MKPVSVSCLHLPMARPSLYRTSTLLLALLMTLQGQCQRSVAPGAVPGHRIPTTRVLGGVQRFRQVLNNHKGRHRLPQVSRHPHGGTPQRPDPPSRYPHTRGPGGTHEEERLVTESRPLLEGAGVRSHPPRPVHNFTPTDKPWTPEAQQDFDELPRLSDRLRAQEAPRVPEDPRALEVPRAPEFPLASHAPRAPEAPRVPENPRALEVPRPPEFPLVSNGPRAPEALRALVNSRSTKPPDRLRASGILPGVPETQSSSRIPRHPETPRNPEAPRVPEVPNHLPVDLTTRLNEFPALAEALQAAPGAVSRHSFFEPTIQVEAVELSDEEWQEYLESEWRGDGVVPQLLDAPPPFLVNVNYGEHHCLHLGNDITPAHARHKPKAFQFPGEEGHHYAVLLLDLDAPDPPYLNWLILNVPTDHLQEGLEAVQYEGPRPGTGTGRHRLVYLVYKQQRPLPSNTPGLPTARTCQSAGREAVDLNRMTRDLGLQTPLAANYFRAEWDVTVEHTCTDDP